LAQHRKEQRGDSTQRQKGGREFHRRGAEREEDAEEDREEQKGNLTQGQKSSSILITSHESQITVERSETQHKGAKAQRSEGKRGEVMGDGWEKFKFESKFK